MSVHHDIPERVSEENARALRRHREMLAVSAGIVLLSLLLVARADGRVAFGFLPRYPLPESCGSRLWFGVACPGCGLTRSLVHLAHGDWSKSLRAHRLGVLMAVVILLQFPYRLVCLARGGRAPFGTVWPRTFGAVLIAALIGNWLIGLIW